MINLSTLEKVIELQKKWPKIDFTEREAISDFYKSNTSHIMIITGIRRCGKSTLLRHFMDQITETNKVYLNFDTPRLFNFDIDDFEVLDLILEKNNTKYLFFDEIQIIKGWEVYIRHKHEQGYKIFITGSNATLLSSEMGTRLTGRHISRELFPFSYQEYLQFKSETNTIETFLDYIETGGFPEYLKQQNPEILQSLLDDILFRDIAVRHGIRDVESLKRLVIYLFSNIGGLITAGKIKSQMGLKSSQTVLEYLHFLEQSYLIRLLPRFSYSYRSQITNPRKIYVIDNGLVNAVSVSFSQNKGRKLENMVFAYLRKHYKEIYYYQGTSSECDFVIFKDGKAEILIQVCSELNTDNYKREVNGLWDAMEFFQLKKGLILTINQQDLINKGKMQINVTSAFHFFDHERE